MRTFKNIQSAKQCAVLLAALLALGVLPSLATAGNFNGINGAEAWYRADSINQVNGSNVTVWADSSGTGNTATTVATFEPTFLTNVYNGQPAVNFNGAVNGEYLNIPSVPLTNTTADWSVFAVVRSNVAPGNTGFFLNGSGNTKVGPWSGGLFTRVVNGGSQTVGPWDIGTNVGIVYFDRNASNLVTTSMNGRTPTAGTTQAGATIFTQIGKDETTNQQFPGNVSEIAMFSRKLNLAERIIVENNLKAKYAIALNTGNGATNVYDGDTLATGNYDLDVTGFGRVDASNIAASGNAAGIRLTQTGGLDNNEFFLAGHKTPINGLTTVEANSNLIVGDRWERVWQLDTNSGAASATIEFDFSDGGIGGLFNVGDSFSLLYSETDPYDWTLLNLTALVSGDAVSFNVPDNLLLNGFFTLGVNAAVFIPAPEPSMGLLVSLGLLGLVRRRRCQGQTSLKA